MKQWASAKTIRSEIADVPKSWLVRFAVSHPEHVRKFAEAKQGALLYSVPAVLNAIEHGELVRKLKTA